MLRQLKKPTTMQEPLVILVLFCIGSWFFDLHNVPDV